MLKKLFYLSIFFTPITFYSQEKRMENTFEKEYLIGVNTILNYSDIYGKNQMAKDYKGTINYSLGISFEYKFKKNLSFLFNINYDRKFTKYEYSEYPFINSDLLSTENELKLNFEYLSIPIMIKYNFPNTFIYSTGGIYYSKLLDVKNYINGSINDLDFNEIFEKYDIGFVFGIGLQVYENEKQTNALNVELRNNLGIKDIGGFFSGIKTNSLYLTINYTKKL